MADEKTDSKDKKKALSTGGLPKMRMKSKLLLFVISLLMIAFIRLGFLFVVIAMLPSIVANYMDVSKHRYTFKSIFAANLSGLLPFLTRIIMHGPSSELLHDIMGSSVTWVTIYGAAAIGWMLVMVCPLLAQAAVVSMHQAQHARYAQIQKKLENEWGPEVTQFSGSSSPKEDD